MVSDNSEHNHEDGTALPSWAQEVGSRLALIVSRIGNDRSVTATGRSARQLKRYAAGDEPPLGVVKALADAAGASFDWIMDGRCETVTDTILEQKALEKSLAAIRKSIRSATTVDDLTHYKEHENVVRHLLSLNDQLQNTIKAQANLRAGSPDFRRVSRRASISTPTTAVAPGVDAELFGRVQAGVSEVYKSSNAKIYPGPLGEEAARIYNDIIAACDDPADYPGALKLALSRLRRELLAPTAEAGSSKEAS